MADSVLERAPPQAGERQAYGDDPSQFAELRLPAGGGPFPVVALVHGGFWRDRYGLSYMRHIGERLVASGVATWTIEYRRLGEEGGGWPGTFLDAAAALDALRAVAPSRRLDLGRLVTIGHSAGGHLALWLAGRHRLAAADPLHSPGPLPVRGAVSLAGVVDLRMAWELRLSEGVVEQLLGGAPSSVPERYASGSPREMLPLGVSQVLVHGTADEPVPYALSRSYVEAATLAGDEARLLSFEGADHLAVVDPLSAIWPTIERTIVRLVTRGADVT